MSIYHVAHMLRGPYVWPCVYFIVKPLYTAVVFRTTESLSSQGQTNQNHLSYQCRIWDTAPQMFIVFLYIFNLVQEKRKTSWCVLLFFSQCLCVCLFVYVCVCPLVLDSIAVSLSQIVSDSRVQITTLILWREALPREHLQKRKNKA